MEISVFFKRYCILLFLSTATLALLSSCGGGGGGDAENNDAAPSTLDGLELVFIQGVPAATLQFARLGGDAAAGGETGFANTIEVGGDGATTIIVDEGGFENVYDLAERFSNIAYTYNKTGTNTGTILITCQTISNETGNVDIFANDDPGVSNLEFELRLQFGANAPQNGFISEIAVTYNEIPVEDDPPTITYVLTTVGTGGEIRIQLQSGGAVPVGYDLDDASGVVKKTPARVYPDKFSRLAILGTMVFDGTGDEYQLTGVSSLDQGFDQNAYLDQGVLNIVKVVGLVEEDLGTVSYAWRSANNQGTDNIAELTLVFSDSSTEIYNFEFASFEEGTFIRTTPDDASAGVFNFPFGD